MYWVAVIIIVLLLFWMMNRSEGFDTVPSTGYGVCGTDGAVCQMRPLGDVYYGVPQGQMTKIPLNTIKMDKSGRFTCLPSGFSSVNGSPVLPISDPVSGQKKTCMIPQLTQCNGVGGACEIMPSASSNYKGDTVNDINENGDIYYGADGGIVVPAAYSLSSSFKSKNLEGNTMMHANFNCIPDKFNDKINEMRTHGYDLDSGAKSCYQWSRDPTTWTQ